MRALGVDYGDARIGIALGDPLGLTAQSYEVIDCRRVRDPIGRISQIAREHEVDVIVMGLPRNMNGTYGERAEKTRIFAQEVALSTGLPVEWMDERLSTVGANRSLLEGDVSRAKRRQVIDKVAATLILQAYLDRKGRA
ncbi:MAG: Holliday junction resolvase RuvX [Firmicutes bacterium]|nr:Holliday junction resolvase RuvX [Bacillota bacterium]